MAEILNLLAIIIVFGVAMWLVNVLIPMPYAIKTLLNLVVLIILIIYVLQFFAIIHPVLPPIRLFR
ncbi:Thivi_2564 family membrane protein [Legionella jordanis]|uniref:Transmembrane protein n=1 Tax=Legionella jordanis TaxID=456 RepID=A0A0W0V8T2_9GAMM|nr:Thivi_2564 family membrane protein [Legionella jordanis]KTD16511.1 hypothetical protein Ljor_0817 [Legionella jordanis]RMX03943.1 hypothetical protein EAW55_06200 [Legionella jordanis]RMX21988.1 hypothetical protein EAS68_00205 [Legionella jordanis]VEH12028.1 Uncharacterised protein [Legionella jordanis]HAT8712670.1 hypothetical protein [Legionella jordanis]